MSPLQELGKITPSLQDAGTQNGIQKLPTELLYHIIRLAASTDYKTAHACAYVSKTVCSWTAPDRWKTIICASVRQLGALHSLLVRRSSEPLRRQSLSLPGRHPGEFVEHLFIDTQRHPLDHEWHSPQRRQHLHGPQAGTDPGGGETPQLRLASIEDSMVQEVLMHCTHVNYLALGPSELSNLEDSCPYTCPKKVMITSDDEDDLADFLVRITDRDQYYTNEPNRHTYNFWQPQGGLEFLGRLQALHVISINRDSEVTGVPMPIRELEALRSGSVDDEGLIRTMARSEFLPPPPGDAYRQNMADRAAGLANIERLRREIPGHKSLDQVQSEHDAFRNPYGRITRHCQNELSHGVTKLRYDTRKFSFRPCEITASRLRPFFEELTTIVAAPSPSSTDRNHDATRSGVAEFAHSGPRHAAPVRGAGNFSVPSSNSILEGEISTPRRAALKFLGCHRFGKLHLCWDPAPASFLPPDDVSAKHVAASPMTVIAAESDWPMERQDIWTNTSQGNEARALPPHMGNAQRERDNSIRSNAPIYSDTPRNEPADNKNLSAAWVIPPELESAQSKAFRADMVDALRTSIGWTRHDQQLLSDTPWLAPDRRRLVQRVGEDGLRELEDITFNVASHINNPDLEYPSGIKSDFKPTGLPLSADEQLGLEFIPPKERLRLGGMYVPYTKEQRIKWFLDNLETDDA